MATPVRRTFVSRLTSRNVVGNSATRTVLVQTLPRHVSGRIGVGNRRFGAVAVVRTARRERRRRGKTRERVGGFHRIGEGLVQLAGIGDDVIERGERRIVRPATSGLSGVAGSSGVNGTNGIGCCEPAVVGGRRPRLRLAEPGEWERRRSGSG